MANALHLFKFPRPRKAGALAGLMALLLLAALAWPDPDPRPIARQGHRRFPRAVRENLLVGYGLVVGLNGTGDDLDSAPFTRESLIGMLQRLGINARDDDLDTENVAAVMVTANLPPFARQGTRIDVTVSALGNAESLLGGTLVVTPLLAATVKFTPCPRAQSQSADSAPRARASR